MRLIRGDFMFTRHRSLLAAGLLGAASMLHAQNSAAVMGPNARFRRVFDGGFFLESPAVAPDGAVYFSDLTYSATSGMQAGHIWKYEPKADFGGRMLVRTDMQTGKSYIAAGLFNGRPFNSPNDPTIDRQGRVFFTDPRYVGHESVDQPVMGVYRLDTDGSVHLIAADVWKPNGIALSPDERTLYVVSVGDFGTDLSATTPPRGGVPSQRSPGPGTSRACTSSPVRASASPFSPRRSRRSTWTSLSAPPRTCCMSRVNMDSTRFSFGRARRTRLRRSGTRGAWIGSCARPLDP